MDEHKGRYWGEGIVKNGLCDSHERRTKIPIGSQWGHWVFWEPNNPSTTKPKYDGNKICVIQQQSKFQYFTIFIMTIMTQ